ncbi:MAG TPA: 5'/3'-nucleotidase SurE [Tepidiformaceae bacterium]|nr:5'/3'-nucleotidase SurE [Tepidiformaceae bacterium]
MKILVTNDDGIESAGLWALVRAVAPFGDVTVVAPSENQSAVGAGLTLRRELKWEQFESPVEGVDAWHVNGTPGDCVIIAMRSIITSWVDLVVSGVNTGANLGNDILASGTVGGALQGHFRDINSIAFSQTMEDMNAPDFDWSTAERVAGLVVRTVTDGIPGPFFLNVNVPACEYEALSGILVTRMGRHGFMKLAERSGQSGVLEKEVDPHLNPDTPPGTDIWAITHNYVSVSPLQANLTDHRLIDALGSKLNAALQE